MPRRARPPKALLEERARMLPPVDEEAVRLTHQAFVDSTYLAGVVSFEKRVDAFLKQPFAKGLGRDRAREVVKSCCEQYARETAEARASALDNGVRTLVDSQSRALQVYQQARRPHSKLLALRVRNESAVKLCRLLGVDEPAQVDVTVTHGFDENLVRAAQETSDDDFQGMIREERKLLGRGALVVEEEADEDDGTRH